MWDPPESDGAANKVFLIQIAKQKQVACAMGGTACMELGPEVCPYLSRYAFRALACCIELFVRSHAKLMLQQVLPKSPLVDSTV